MDHLVNMEVETEILGGLMSGSESLLTLYWEVMLQATGWNFISRANRDAGVCNLSRCSVIVPLVGTPQELRHPRDALIVDKALKCVTTSTSCKWYREVLYRSSICKDIEKEFKNHTAPAISLRAQVRYILNNWPRQLEEKRLHQQATTQFLADAKRQEIASHRALVRLLSWAYGILPRTIVIYKETGETGH
ncbi:hypothetical protein Tco_0454520 [Tanacetum coccineum]